MLPANSLVIPLDRQGYLQGFVVLGKPPGLRSLNFDDHDILKTAARQVAAVLGQAIAQEKLAETRQFEALNRLSAFLMHDLKNIVAQQEPFFVDHSLTATRPSQPDAQSNNSCTLATAPRCHSRVTS